MGRKLYFFLVLVFICSSANAWTSYQARVGAAETQPYQSSNPKVELRTTRNINQHSSEECYLFAFVGALEVANLNGWNRQLSPEISAEYLFVQKLMSWSYEVMTNETKMNDTFYFLDGGDVHHALKLSVDHGLLPQEFFKPRIPFANWDVAKLYSDVKEIAKEGRSVLSRVTDDSIRKQVLRIFIRKIQDRIVVESGTMPARFL